MGLSSREPYNCETPEESADYLIKSIEAWREKIGAADFILVGHSLGGYVSCLYASKYSDHIRKLFLLSPVGFSEKPPNFDIKNI